MAVLCVSSIARAAGADRSFFYRHRDLLAQLHALETQPPAGAAGAPTVTRASLQADLLAAHDRALRLNARVAHLEKHLSEALGERAWRDSGLGAPADVDALHQRITHLEQQAVDLGLQLEEREQDLAAPAPPTATSWPRSTRPTATGEPLPHGLAPHLPRSIPFTNQL